MTNTTKQAENLKTWPEKVYATKEIWGRFPSNVPEYQTEIGENVFGFDNLDNIPCVEYIRADTVRALQLEAIRKTLEAVNNKVAKLHKMLGVKGTFIAEQIAQLDEEEILNLQRELIEKDE